MKRREEQLQSLNNIRHGEAMKAVQNFLEKRRESLVPATLLMVAAYCLFANTFQGAWVYDDFPVIVNNADVRSLKDIFANTYPGRPLREVTYLLDYALFGLDPGGWRIQNIFWHGLNSGLLFMLVRRLGGKITVAWTAALVFLAHPIVVEVVANTSHRKDSLALAFSLLSVLSFREVFQEHRHGLSRLLWLVGALGLGGIAFLAKETAIGLPLIFVGVELAFVPRERRLLARLPRIWGAGLAGGMAVALFWYVVEGGRDTYLRQVQFLFSKMNYFSAPREDVYLLMLLKSWAFMLLKLVVPSGLAVEYAYPVPASWADAWVLFALAGLLSFGFLFFFSLKRSPLVFFSLAWMGSFLLLVSNLWPLAYFAADRYLYAPAAGFSLLVAVMMERVFARKDILRYGATVLLIMGLSILTWQQNRVWASEFSLWSRAAETSPQSAYALNNLGVVYARKNEMQRAFQLIQKAAENPFYVEAQENMARYYEWLGNRQKADYYYQRARNPHAMTKP